MGSIPLSLHGNRCPREAEVYEIHLRNDFVKRYSISKANAKSRIGDWRVAVKEFAPRSEGMPVGRRAAHWSIALLPTQNREIARTWGAAFGGCCAPARKDIRYGRDIRERREFGTIEQRKEF